MKFRLICEAQVAGPSKALGLTRTKIQLNLTQIIRRHVSTVNSRPPASSRRTRATNPRRVQPLLPFLASFVRARGVSRRIVSREAPGPGTVRRSRRRSGAPSASVTLSASIALDAKRMPA